MLRWQCLQEQLGTRKGDERREEVRRGASISPRVSKIQGRKDQFETRSESLPDEQRRRIVAVRSSAMAGSLRRGRSQPLEEGIAIADQHSLNILN